MIYEGYSFVNAYDFKSASLKFIEYASVVKKDDCYYLGMSICSYGFDDFISAEAFLDSAGLQKNNLSEYYYLKGIYALRNKKYQKAEKAFEKSRDVDKKNVRTINGLGAALNGLHDYEKSILVFNEGLILKPNDPFLVFNKASAVFNIAKKLFENGAVKQAADTLKYGLDLMNKVSVIAPNFFLDINIGNAYSSVKDSANALAYYNKVSNLASEVNIGVLYACLKMDNKAKKIWEQVRDTDTSFVLAAYNIKAIDMPYKVKSKKGGREIYTSERFQYYENFYFEIGYHWKAPIPVLFESSFESLVPLGYSNLRFTKISKEVESKEEKEE